MYIANHYVRDNGKLYTAGERIPDSLSPDKIRWLLASGAIREDVPVLPNDPEPEPEPVPEEPEVTAEPDFVVPGPPEIDVADAIVPPAAEAQPKKRSRRKGG